MQPNRSYATFRGYMGGTPVAARATGCGYGLGAPLCRFTQESQWHGFFRITQDT